MKKKKEEKKRKNKIYFFTSFFLILNFIIVFLFFETPLVIAGLLLFLSILGLLIWNSKRTLVVFSLALLFGILFEIFAVTLGVINYSFPASYGIPIWTAILLGNISAFIYQKSKEIKESKIQ
jgi:hypothetical protein